jgi:RecA-family ATPase
MSDVYTKKSQEFMGQNPDSKDTSSDGEHPVGEMVSGMWVVSGEDMPALSAYQEAKGDYIIAGGILGKQEKRITYAHPKHLKTMLEIWKGMCIATATPFFGYPVKQGRVLYVGMEDTLPKLSNRVEKMKQHFPPIDESKFTVLPTDKRNMLAIEALIIQLKPDVVMIDPLTNLLKREDKKEDVESLLKELDRLIEQYEISIILIHHARKGKGETLDSMRGSSALTGWADTICRIDRRGNNKYKIKLDFEWRSCQ